MEQARKAIAGTSASVDPELMGAVVCSVDVWPEWVPITRRARGRDSLCLDPAPGNTAGQVSKYVADDNARQLAASRFAELLACYFELAQMGELDLHEGEDDEDLDD